MTEISSSDTAPQVFKPETRFLQIGQPGNETTGKASHLVAVSCMLLPIQDAAREHYECVFGLQHHSLRLALYSCQCCSPPGTQHHTQCSISKVCSSKGPGPTLFRPRLLSTLPALETFCPDPEDVEARVEAHAGVLPW